MKRSMLIFQGATEERTFVEKRLKEDEARSWQAPNLSTETRQRIRESKIRNILRERYLLSDAQDAALFGDKGLISKQGQTIAIPKKDHQQHSETYGRRNNPDKIDKDSSDLQKAAERDTKAIEDAEGKEMDEECAKKYKKAAEEIRKKTHEEHMQDIKNLIKDVMKNVK